MEKTIAQLLENYRDLKYQVNIVPSGEGGFVVTFPDLAGVVAEGETLAEALAAAEELRLLWTEARLEQGWEVPMPGEMKNCTGVLTVRIPPDLHKRLGIRAKSEKISLNRLISYLLATSLSNPAVLDNLPKATRRGKVKAL